MARKPGTNTIELKKAGTSIEASDKNFFRTLAFEESSQAKIVSTIKDGKIIIVNKAACKLLGYSKKELLTKERKDIFYKKNTSFKSMLKNKQFNGEPIGIIYMIKRTGEHIPCEVTSVILKVKDGIETGIIIITDLRERITKQKELDFKNVKIVAHNISLAIQAKQN